MTSRPETSAEPKSTVTRVRVASPPELLGIVPALLGFHPEASVVIVGIENPGMTLKVCARYALDPDLAAYSIEHALKFLSARNFAQAMAIGYGPAEQVDPFVERMREGARPRGIQLMDLLRVEEGRYWSYTCTDHECCSPDGSPFDLAPDAELGKLLVEGVPGVLASRVALAELLAPVGGAETDSMLAAIQRAQAHAAELVERARASTSRGESRQLIAQEGIEAVQRAIAQYRREAQTISHDEAAWLLVSLRDLWVRDDALCRMQADGRQANLRLWLDLTFLAPSDYAAAPASLLAFVAWQCGNGALANVALDRADSGDPDYKLATLLRQFVTIGVRPSNIAPPITPEEVAEHYRKTGTPRSAMPQAGTSR